MKFKTLAIITLTALLTACGEEETKTVEYYKEHIAERDAKVKECVNNPGEKSNAPNCINAKQALRLSTSTGGKMRDYSNAFD